MFITTLANKRAAIGTATFVALGLMAFAFSVVLASFITRAHGALLFAGVLGGSACGIAGAVSTLRRRAREDNGTNPRTTSSSNAGSWPINLIGYGFLVSIALNLIGLSGNAELLISLVAAIAGCISLAIISKK